MLFVIISLWIARTVKAVAFWLYLWQLKEYHIGRFTDHFRTYKGKKLLTDSSRFLKLALLLLLSLAGSSFIFAYYCIFVIYVLELISLLKSFVDKTLKTPKRTAKILLLALLILAVFSAVLFQIYALNDLTQLIWILFFDILTPFIVSGLVLIIQPFFVAIRNRLLKKAGEKMAQAKFNNKLKVIAITGSYGKTSTKEFLATILSRKFKVLATKNHQNSEIGVAKTVLGELEPSHEIFIAEVGAYNKGKVREVCSMILPDFGVVTGVNQQHMALFGSIENLLSAEGGWELAELLPENGMLFVNGDNKYCLELIKKSNRLPENREKIYATGKEVVNADIWAYEIEVKKDRVLFLSSDKNKNLAHFDVRVLGKQNVQNLLAAILVASEMGMPIEEIIEASKNIKPGQAGTTLKTGKHGIEIIDSSYSSNPDGVFADIEYLSVFPKKKILIMPCLIELGKEAKSIHAEIGKKIGQNCDMAIITTKEYFENIKKTAIEFGMKEKNILFLEEPQEIYSAVTTFCKSGDAVLLEGRVPTKLINLLK